MAKAQAIAATIDQLKTISNTREELLDRLKKAVEQMTPGVYSVDGERVLVVREEKNRSKGYHGFAYNPETNQDEPVATGGKKIAYIEYLIKE